ncbi:polygalacturonase-like [Ziziphus jujuba]|uniref:Polygalacturonase-like n=1 Tax=Ziziphus jujuba TaxID=326968 RepID=A0ABM4A121_ZIZJJ|nr:polygalacturonase-like [Ziziphus jujuba]
MSRKIHLLLPLLLVIFSASFSLSFSHGVHRKGMPKISSLASSRPYKIINVDDFGAKGDGKTDDSKAFKSAWNKACSSEDPVVLLVPNNKYLLKPMRFSGPCKSDQLNNHRILRIKGTIVASDDRSDYKDRRHWLVFEEIDHLRVEGSGTFDGNGKIWWQKSCKINKSLPCSAAPTAVTFIRCNHLRVAGLNFLNAQKMHLSFQKCVNVKALNLKLTAPEHSPNTDGIHITATRNIRLSNCTIGTGDDCISIVSGSKNILATDITCGPGHGISIGSLGARNSEDHVSNVFVDRATFTGTTNGVRIKTWQGGSGYAKVIRFLNIIMNRVKNPIIIDQDYCDQKKPCHEQKSAVQISNVIYSNITGTSSSKVAIKLDCSENLPCQDIVMHDVNLVTNHGKDDDNVKASCENVHFKRTPRKVFPSC